MVPNPDGHVDFPAIDGPSDRDPLDTANLVAYAADGERYWIKVERVTPPEDRVPYSETERDDEEVLPF